MCALGSMRKHARCHGVRFSGADRKRLTAALETAREARVYRRVEALLLVAEGQTVAEAARPLPCRSLQCAPLAGAVWRTAGCSWARGSAAEWPTAAEQLAHAAAAGGGPGT